MLPLTVISNRDLSLQTYVHRLISVLAYSFSRVELMLVCGIRLSTQINKSGWWKDMMDGRPREVADMSGKMVILLQILSMSSAKGDKALVFSQSLHTLDLIEIFLENTPCLHGFKGNWKKNRDWYRYCTSELLQS